MTSLAHQPIVETASPLSPIPTEAGVTASSPVLQESARSGLQALTDDQREAAIRLAAKAMEKHYARWEQTGCFAARGDADRARLSMEALIRGRSPEMVARLERERGII